MVHYSSRVIYYEGGAKNPLKGIHEASCLCAKCQFCVYSGSKEVREVCNGIHMIPGFVEA